MPLSPDPGAGKPPGSRTDAPMLERQRALLYHLLTVTREQRRCLIEGDLKGLDEANRLLGDLLASQQALHREGFPPEEEVDPELVAELRSVAQQLRQESRTNYLLACRAAQFADFSLSLISAAGDGSAPAADPGDPSTGRRAGPCVMDRPA